LLLTHVDLKLKAPRFWDDASMRHQMQEALARRLRLSPLEA
jgi:hypothetical protein